MGATGGNEGIATYPAGMGFIFIFNLIVGTGALTMPKAFAEAGWILSTIVLVTLGVVSYITVSFVVEAMSTGNALKRVKTGESNESLNEISGAEEVTPLLPAVNNPTSSQSIFEIREQLEMAHLAQMVFSKFGVILFYLSLCIYLFGDLTIYATAVPKSIRDVACTYKPPGNTNLSMNEVDEDISHTESLLPIDNTSLDIGNSRCWESVDLSRSAAYRIFVGCFFLLLGPFVFFNVSKMKYIQLLTSFLRWFSFSIMFVLTSIRLAKGEGRGNPPEYDLNGVPNLFGICVYSFMCHHSLPALITPIKQKSRLTAVLLSNYVLILIFYLALSYTEIFSFKDLQDLCTLNFQPNHDVPITDVKFFQYFLALFPAFTLSTNFPILAITLRNSLRHLFSPVLARTHQFVSKYVVPVAVLVPSCIIAMSTENVTMLVGITGSYAGVAIQYIIPAFLVLYSRRAIRDYLPVDIQYDERFKQKHKSIFGHWIFPVFVLVWSLFVYVIVTYYNLMKF